MSVVPALDLRPAADDRHPHDPASAPSGPPASIEAEQALLGAVLYDNEAVHLIEGLEPQHFIEPFHGDLWEWMADRVGKGVLAEPINAAQHFERHPAFLELGGVRYLAELVDRAPPTANAPEYARQVIDLAARRDLLKLAGELLHHATEAVRVEDAIGHAEAGLLAMQVSTRKVALVTAGVAAARVLERLDAPADERSGIATGIEPLDEELGPLQPGNLILGMARPSMGKSATSENIAHNVAEAGHGVVQINVEMSEEEMAERHLTDICHRLWGAKGPEYRDIRRRRVSYDQRQMLGRAQEVLDRLPLVMLRRPGIRLSQLRSLARRQAAEWSKRNIPLGLLIVDHVGRVQPDERTKDRYTAQSLVSAAMKELADELGCPILALNQMSRENERRDDKRPQLSDLRDSGTWEEDADIVVGFFREAYYAQRQAEPKQGAPGSKEDAAWGEWDRARRSQTVEAIILKARAGACSTVKLWGDVARNAIRGHAPEGDLF